MCRITLFSPCVLQGAFQTAGEEIAGRRTRIGGEVGMNQSPIVYHADGRCSVNTEAIALAAVDHVGCLGI